MALVTLSVFLGLTLSTRWPMQRLGRKRALMVVHEQAALAGLVSIAVHAIALLGDAFLHPAPYDVIVPFTLDHARVWTGLGVIAMWLAALLGLSAYFRQRIGARRWRSLHRLTLLVYVLALAHALGAGTDAENPVVRLACSEPPRHCCSSPACGCSAAPRLPALPPGNQLAEQFRCSVETVSVPPRPRRRCSRSARSASASGSVSGPSATTRKSACSRRRTAPRRLPALLRGRRRAAGGPQGHEATGPDAREIRELMEMLDLASSGGTLRPKQGRRVAGA
jgi:sulfoxide reductase heme-binding subunit YedZ